MHFGTKAGPALPTLKANIINIGNNNILDTDITAIKQMHGKGFSIGYGLGNFAYSTDVNEFPKESYKLLQDLDLWIVDCVRYEPHYSHSI